MSAASEKLRMLANDLDWYSYDIPSEVVHTMRGIAAAMEDELDRMDRWHSANLQAAMAENAKLRELVRDMWICVREGEWDCSDCPRYVGCNDGVSEFRGRMHDLGIEVDA